MEFRMGPLDLASIVRNVSAEFGPLFETRQQAVKLKLPEAAAMHGDAERLAQVVRNLLSNAGKFSPAGAEIGVSLEAAELASAPAWQLSVEDAGPGIPEAELASIFNKFVQSSLTATGAGGTGLGLAICYEIVNHHCGMITAANRPAGGARFTVLLPATPAVSGPPEMPGV